METDHLELGAGKWPIVERQLNKTKSLLRANLRQCDDLLIMLSLHTSYCLMATRRLISSERDLQAADAIYASMIEPSPDQRPDFYITPKPILRQRIELQRARIEKEYG